MESDDESVEKLEIVDLNDVPDITIIETNEFASKSVAKAFRYLTYWEDNTYQPTKCKCNENCDMEDCRNRLVDCSFCDELNCNIYTRENGYCGNLYISIHDTLQLVRFEDGSYGVFNNIRSIQRREYIGEYTGYVDTLSNYKKKELIRYRYGYQNYYSFIAQTKYTVDAFDRGSLLRFVNHSCDPNCEVEILVRLGYFVVMFTSLRFIPKGTEITISYMDKREELGFICNCGSTNCINRKAKIAKNLILSNELDRTGEPSLFVNSKNKFGLYSCFLNSMLTVIGSQTDLITAMFPLEALKPLPTIMEGLHKVLTIGGQTQVIGDAFVFLVFFLNGQTNDKLPDGTIVSSVNYPVPYQNFVMMVTYFTGVFQNDQNDPGEIFQFCINELFKKNDETSSIIKQNVCYEHINIHDCGCGIKDTKRIVHNEEYVVTEHSHCYTDMESGRVYCRRKEEKYLMQILLLSDFARIGESYQYSVEEAIERTLQSYVNETPCESCQFPNKGYSNIARFGKVLIICLPSYRIASDGKMIPKHTKVQVSEHVRYKLPNGLIANFELVGCTFNISTSASSGHHISYCKDKLNTEFNFKQKWFKANCISEQKQFGNSRNKNEKDLDTEELTTKRGHITPMNIENVQTADDLRKSRAHILFYVRKDQQ